MAYKRMMEIIDLPAKSIIRELIIDDTMGREIKALIEANPMLSARTIEVLLKEKMPKDMQLSGVMTIYNFLQDSGFKMVKALKKQLISTANQKKRLAFA